MKYVHTYVAGLVWLCGAKITIDHTVLILCLNNIITVSGDENILLA